LRDNAVLAPPVEESTSRCNWQSFPVRIRADAKLSQRAIMQRFLDAAIATKRGVSNAHQEPAYRDGVHGGCASLRSTTCERGCATGTCARLPESERARDGIVLLPLFHGMRDDVQDRVLAVCRALHDEHLR
jgi:dTDP-4-amino-4,6-dideoxygalactose transaminase